MVDITHRLGGVTQIGSPSEHTALLRETSQGMLDRMVVALSGSAAERVVLGEHTDGGQSDNDSAVDIAVHWLRAGFAGPGVFLGEDGLPVAT